MNKLIFLLTFFVSTLSVFSQMTDEQLNEFIKNAKKSELVVKNTEMNLDGLFYQSDKIADRLLEIDPDNPNFNYRKGYALLYLTLDHRKAAPFLKKASRKVTKNYDIYSANESRSPLEVHYFLASVYQLNNEIDSAEYYYNKFLENPPKESDLVEKTQLKLKQCGVARDLMNKEGDKYVLENIGSPVNTEFPEYAPVISLDGSSLYYTARRIRADSSNYEHREPGSSQYPEDIYVSHLNENGEFGEPELLEFCTPDQNEATAAVSTDMRTIYVYKDHKGYGDIYYSDFQGSKFREIVDLEIEGINTESWETHITVSRDGTVMYFASDRKGGLGGRDIYRIAKDENGDWGEPKNVGAPINSQYDEDSPFIAVDNKTLYFASNGDKSMGGFDIFKTTLKEDGSWSEPENLGIPLNTAGDDIYYTTTADGLTGYISSFRPGGKGEKDIYRINNTHLGIENLVGLKGQITTIDDQDLPEDVAYSIRCLNCDDGSYEIKLFPRVDDRTYYANVLPCKKYEITYHNENGKNIFFSDTFETECGTTEYTEVSKDITLDVETMVVTLSKDELAFSALEFKHLFGYNNNKLDPSTGTFKEFLSIIEEQLEEGREDFTLEINASASKVRTRTFKSNQELARTRAEKVKKLLEDYFASKDVNTIEININEVKVDGPDYKLGDFKNIKKYAPYQYVNIKVKGINNEDDEIKVKVSEDKELKEHLN